MIRLIICVALVLSCVQSAREFDGLFIDENWDIAQSVLKEKNTVMEAIEELREMGYHVSAVDIEKLRKEKYIQVANKQVYAIVQSVYQDPLHYKFKERASYFDENDDYVWKMDDEDMKLLMDMYNAGCPYAEMNVMDLRRLNGNMEEAIKNCKHEQEGMDGLRGYIVEEQEKRKKRQDELTQQLREDFERIKRGEKPVHLLQTRDSEESDVEVGGKLCPNCEKDPNWAQNMWDRHHEMMAQRHEQLEEEMKKIKEDRKKQERKTLFQIFRDQGFTDDEEEIEKVLEVNEMDVDRALKAMNTMRYLKKAEGVANGLETLDKVKMIGRDGHLTEQSKVKLYSLRLNGCPNAEVNVNTLVRVKGDFSKALNQCKRV